MLVELGVLWWDGGGDAKYSRFELCHGLHRMLDGRLAVHAVEVVQVDAVDAETL